MEVNRPAELVERAGKRKRNMEEKDKEIQLTEFFRKEVGVPRSVPMEEILAAVQVKRYEVGENLYEYGKTPNELYFMLHGVIRGVEPDFEGKDITDCFAFRRGELIVPDNELGVPSSLNIEALEVCEVVALPLETVWDLLQRYPALILLYLKFFKSGADRHREIKRVRYKYSASQRYEWFLSRYPTLIDRIPHRYIASFLDMTPVTLSKVRKNTR